MSKLENIIYLATENQSLRGKTVHLERSEHKCLKLGGNKRRKSKFYPVICSVRVIRSEIKEQLVENLAIANLS